VGHWFDNYPREPTLQEQRADDPTARPQRARKDRRRWCGGHVGREHVPVVRMSKWGRYHDTAGHEHAGHCGWRPRYRWLRTGERVPDGALERRHGIYTVIDRYTWSCWHERGCERCGKVLELTLGRQCPDFSERLDG
jgi:hypothetical protein